MGQLCNIQGMWAVTKDRSSAPQQAHTRLVLRTRMLQSPQCREQRPMFKVQDPSRILSMEAPHRRLRCIHRLQDLPCQGQRPMLMVLTLSHILSMEVFRQQVTHPALTTEDHHRTLQRAMLALSHILSMEVSLQRVTHPAPTMGGHCRTLQRAMARLSVVVRPTTGR
jgi:hypothetical protein